MNDIDLRPLVALISIRILFAASVVGVVSAIVKGIVVFFS